MPCRLDQRRCLVARGAGGATGPPCSAARRPRRRRLRPWCGARSPAVRRRCGALDVASSSPACAPIYKEPYAMARVCTVPPLTRLADQEGYHEDNNSQHGHRRYYDFCEHQSARQPPSGQRPAIPSTQIVSQEPKGIAGSWCSLFADQRRKKKCTGNRVAS